MIMPDHHMKLLRYCTPSPAVVSYFFCAASRPFFLSTKLEPMKNPEAIAMPMPMYLKYGGLDDSPAAMRLSEASAAEAELMTADSECIADDAAACEANDALTAASLFVDVATAVAAAAVADAAADVCRAISLTAAPPAAAAILGAGDMMRAGSERQRFDTRAAASFQSRLAWRQGSMSSA